MEDARASSGIFVLASGVARLDSAGASMALACRVEALTRAERHVQPTYAASGRAHGAVGRLQRQYGLHMLRAIVTKGSSCG